MLSLSCFPRMICATMSQHFQRASGSATEQAWLGGCCPLCSTAGGRCSTEPLAEDLGAYGLSKNGGTAEQHREHSPAWVSLKMLCFQVDSRKPPRWQTLNLLARTALQGCCRQQQDYLLQPFCLLH